MLRPQDLVILLKVVVAAQKAQPWNQKELSLTTGLSQPEISLVLKRSADAGL